MDGHGLGEAGLQPVAVERVRAAAGAAHLVALEDVPGLRAGRGRGGPKLGGCNDKSTVVVALDVFTHLIIIALEVKTMNCQLKKESRLAKASTSSN